MERDLTMETGRFLKKGGLGFDRVNIMRDEVRQVAFLLGLAEQLLLAVCGSGAMFSLVVVFGNVHGNLGIGRS
jgi:hypothetical protein